jgi:sulfur carrier protein ThiS
MSAWIKPTSLLKSYTPGKTNIQVETDGKTVKDYLISLNIPPELVALVMVNGTAKDKDYIVQDEDLIQLIPLIGGG